jgi:phenylpropionate dioxygenase-like ring-hydroxylating dioxygenase large terminal subunit
MSEQTAQQRIELDEDTAGLGTDPIPAGPYYQPEYFAWEREAIFRRTWLQIGHVCELPEADSFIVREVEIANASILITRGRDDRIRAFHNVCTHRGTQLVAEQGGRRALFSCPYHMWTFSGDGELRSAPDFERFYVDKSQCSLPEVAVDVCAGLIFINLDNSPPQGLREYLGPMADKLETLPVASATTFSEYVYEIEGNWKITYDNFQENYHLRFIHPRSGEASGGPQNPFGYPVEYGFQPPHRTQLIWSNPDARPKPVQMLAFMKGAGFAARDGFTNPENAKRYFAIFPNLFVFGSPTTPFSQCVVPLSPTRSRGIIRLYWSGDDDCASRRFSREYAMALAKDIHSEDISVIEAGQRGLSSGALSHIHFQSQEILCRHLFHEVNNRVEAYLAERDRGGRGNG